MKQFSFKDSMVIKIKSEGLTEQQKRLIKSLNSHLVELLHTEKEETFFKKTEDAVKFLAAIVKQSHFNSFVKSEDDIAYAEQALESSFDSVTEKLYTSETVIYDN